MSENIKRTVLEDIPRGGPYSQMVQHGGVAYLSGMVGTVKGEKRGFDEQWTEIIRRAAKILATVGSDPGKDTIKATVYLSSKEFLKDLNRRFEETFAREAPARTTIVCGFVSDEVIVELDLIVAVQ